MQDSTPSHLSLYIHRPVEQMHYISKVTEYLHWKEYLGTSQNLRFPRGLKKGAARLPGTGD